MADEQALTPTELLDATRGLAVALRLLLLDNVWTNEAKVASGPDRTPDRVKELSPIVDEMDSLFQECVKIAPTIADIGTRRGSVLRGRFEDLGKGALVAHVSTKRLTEIFARLDHHVKEKGDGDPGRYLAVQAADLASRASKEVADLRGELKKITDGGTSNGDMSEEAQQEVAAVALGAGLLLGPEAAAVVIVVAEVVDCLTG